MRDIKLGDQVLTANPYGKQAFETVFMFSHFSAERMADVSLTTQSNFSLSLTAGHYLNVGITGLAMRPRLIGKECEPTRNWISLLSLNKEIGISK
ncbi:hypothetical protein WJX84_011918 [Apatococcus fuscideae]|uniref:Hint domain-containing protein n=1 Tax=Apatococcus fuscideae TaxID=2026836 RepID=A0AAW1T0Z9_9CHLO